MWRAVDIYLSPTDKSKIFFPVESFNKSFPKGGEERTTLKRERGQEKEKGKIWVGGNKQVRGR